ncbi:MAG: B12-binding domain-containing radical SAM protein [Planctomycetota bacterium]|jgi:pyruvate-formate lyase-activating enzyme
MKPKILLVNPPIYDFAAYDFWLKPYGMLRVGGLLRPFAELSLFDYTDRLHPAFAPAIKAKTDRFSKGPYPFERIPNPTSLKDIPRYYRRFGMPRKVFHDFLSKNNSFDFVLIQTVMTYWTPGYREVIEDIRQFCPKAKIVLGGFYATACCDHAKSLGADTVIAGDNLDPLWKLIGQKPPAEPQTPAWKLYPKLEAAVMTLTHGCPFKCSYCYVPQSGRKFKARPLNECLAELKHLVNLGAKNIAFYDDALLYQPEQIITPFLQAVIDNRIDVNFHTPNAMHARFITPELSDLMVRAGFKTFYLGFESRSEAFHKKTGSGKVVSDELAAAVEYLKAAGADPNLICAYEILGHPLGDVQQLEESMRFANSLGIRIMLSDFSPIPGTPDGELCRKYTDLNEPLNHNKTAFPIRFLGFDKVNYYKDLCRKLNRSLQEA